MIDKKYFGLIRQDLLSYALKRREVIKVSGDAQQLAKKSIFARQRDDAESAKNYLTQAGGLLVEIFKKYKSEPDLFREGCYRAALEEYAEADLFSQFFSSSVLGKIRGPVVDSDVYIGGLCDVPGELLRYAIKSATERNFELVKKCYAVAEEIINELVDMDLTGYNRQKFDQAKQALNKLQQIVYEVSMK